MTATTNRPKIKRTHFFESSRFALQKITDLCNFVLPTAAALWSLRWQVSGFYEVCSSNSSERDNQLNNRFVSGSDLPTGGDLIAACIGTSWDEQKQKLAEILLIDFCSIYEFWCDGIVSEVVTSLKAEKGNHYSAITLGNQRQDEAWVKQRLQFPEDPGNTKPKRRAGIKSALAALSGENEESDILSNLIYPKLVGNKKYSLGQLNELIYCYRYFKELRNNRAHHGQVTPDFLISQSKYSSLSETELFGSGDHGRRQQEKPEYIHFTPGSGGTVPDISLRGLIGFGEVISRIITSVDIELSKSKNAEHVLIHRLKSMGVNEKIKTRDKSKIKGIVGKLFYDEALLPKPKPVSQELIDLLHNNGIIDYEL